MTPGNDEPLKPKQLNVSLDGETHRRAKKLGADLDKPLTVLVPMLVREALEARKAAGRPCGE